MRYLACLAALAVFYPVGVQAHPNHDVMGWTHPLTGLDHVIAMVAVGAWSAMLGGRAVWLVPSFFVVFMLVGSLVGLNLIEVPYSEQLIALSVIILGTAIATVSRVSIVIAALGTGLFGFAHGYAHGYEIPVLEHAASFIAGFMVTTALLHVAGLVLGSLLIKSSTGLVTLRIAGVISALVGIYLLYGTLS